MRASPFYIIPFKKNTPISNFPVFTTTDGVRLVEIKAFNIMFSKYVVIHCTVNDYRLDEYISEYIAINHTHLYPDIHPDIILDTFVELETLCIYLKNSAVIPSDEIQYILNYTSFNQIESLYFKRKKESIIENYKQSPEYKKHISDINTKYEEQNKQWLNAEILKMKKYIEQQTTQCHLEYDTKLDYLKKKAKRMRIHIDYYKELQKDPIEIPIEPKQNVSFIYRKLY